MRPRIETTNPLAHTFPSTFPLMAHLKAQGWKDNEENVASLQPNQTMQQRLHQSFLPATCPNHLHPHISQKVNASHSGQVMEVLTRPTRDELSSLSQSNSSTFWKTFNCSSLFHPQNSSMAQLSICRDYQRKKEMN